MEYCAWYVLLVLVVLTSPTSPSHADPSYHQKWQVNIEPLGCFKDSIPRALSQMFFNARENFDWNAWPNMSDVINACASHARADGFQVFGVQHYGECWGEPGDARLSTYDKYGPSDKCVQGVGGDWSNYVYRILPEGCYDKGNKVLEGHRWATWLNAEDCRQCVCKNGQAHCSTRKYWCLPCAKPVIVEGQCCPLCGTPTTQPWLTIPVTTDLPQLTLPPFPAFPPEAKRRLLDWLMKPKPEKKRSPTERLLKRLKQRMQQRTPKNNLR